MIGSATRAHRQLTDDDVTFLMETIKKNERNNKIENTEEVRRHLLFYDEGGDLIPLEEVQTIREAQIQLLLRKNPSVIEPKAKVVAWEKVMPDGDRLDLLLECHDDSLLVVEIKGPHQATESVTTQVASYASDLKKEYPKRRIRKMIICDGNISSKLKKACKEFEIEVMVYGMRLSAFKME